MKKLEDKIYDAYYSENDTVFRKKVRERVHWVCSNTTGFSILDIGCSQGITSIILGREGKNVKGLDISENAINDAKANLKKEEYETQECVSFERANFMLKTFDEEFDSIILGEVLEHITDIESFFNKAVSLLRDKGRLIITTPFGINDFPDHKRTFYLKDFLLLQNNEAVISELKFFGKWIGVIYERKSSGNILSIDDSLLQQFEETVYDIERSYINNENKLKKKITLLSDELNNNKMVKAKFINGPDEITKLKDLYHQEKLQKAQLQKELIEVYQKEEKVLKDYKQILENSESLLKRYNNLKNSKLGKLTTKYWNIRKGKRSK
ncbi:class I SAM-dependent methyltransferase [Gracilibacillus dipsosauri]|uniref:class I SAM-dependent methyltransferase n=1 Tax=Gracilibacillus dipsosauri TaxID=178340 RepID=UPI0024091B56